MKIMPVSQDINSKKQTGFSAGKVKLFADFDRTFLPSTQKDFSNNHDANYYNMMQNIFTNFKNFLDKTKKSLFFTITTGRTYAEYETIAEIARDRKFNMPFPDNLIVKNGSDEHIKISTDEEFYNGGYFPFAYSETNKTKEEEIKKLTGWDGEHLKKTLIGLFKKYDFHVVEAGSEHSKEDYGWRSLFDDANPDKLHYEMNNTFQGTDKPEWKVGFRNDGNLKIFYTLPFELTPPTPERVVAIKDIEDTFFSTLRTQGIKFKDYTLPQNKECAERPCRAIEPLVDENLQYFSDKKVNQGLTKFYDTQKAVEEAKRNNDLVIVAGDSSNDETMLNPMFYIATKYAEKHITDATQKKDFLQNIKDTKKAIEYLDQNEELRKMFFELPFVGVIVKPKNETSTLENLIDAFGQGTYKKIVVVNEGELEQGTKEAIKFYCEQNSNYKEKLGSDLEKEIFGTKKIDDKSNDGSSSSSSDSSSGSSDGSGDNPKEGKTLAQKLGITALIAGICGAGYITLKHNKNEKTKLK